MTTVSTRSRPKLEWLRCVVIVILIVLYQLRLPTGDLPLPRNNEDLLLLFPSSSTFSADKSRQVTATNSMMMQKKRPKIAIISGFVPSRQYKNVPPRVKMLDHLINKACYSKIWGYDFIFNTTYGFDPLLNRHWLEYGTWHRVPHIQDRIQDYDWILYADIDWVIKDMTRPLESFLNEFEFYGKNPSIFVPRDGEMGPYTFSAFAVFIRNDPFGRRVLENWMEFAKGLCKNGNFPSQVGKYSWTDSDQPGLWYSLIKTHKEFFPSNEEDVEKFPVCDETSGLIDAPKTFASTVNSYFRALNMPLGNYGADLAKVHDDQPIIWSTHRQDSRTGLGVQMNWGMNEDTLNWAFAIHKKKNWPEDMQRELAICKARHGCYANYTEDSRLHIGCNGIEFNVAHPIV